MNSECWKNPDDLIKQWWSIDFDLLMIMQTLSGTNRPQSLTLVNQLQMYLLLLMPGLLSVPQINIDSL